MDCAVSFQGQSLGPIDRHLQKQSNKMRKNLFLIEIENKVLLIRRKEAANVD